MKSYKKIICTIFLGGLFVLNSVVIVQAHSGRTDANGGHRDNKNVSGLGSYHYHHGYGPHLHDNGCPYEGGGAEVSNQNAQVEAEKKEAYNKGYNDGYNNGYNEVSEGNSKYSGSYTSDYKSGYDSGYKKGYDALQNEKKAAYDQGVLNGKDGAENKNGYKNKLLAQSFNNGYEAGYKEYKAKKISEYTLLGGNDGKADKDMINLDSIKDEDINNAYRDSYNEAQKKVSLKYYGEGYQRALLGVGADTNKYTKDRHKSWYSQGYNEGTTKLGELKELTYNQGYNKDEYKLPEDLKAATEVCKVEYNLGVEARAKKDKAISVGFVTILAATGGFGVWKFKIKK